MRKSLALLPLALPLLAVPLLLATTRGETSIRPVALVGLASAALFTVLTAAGGREARPWIDLPLAGALGLAAGHILFAPGLPRGHDTFHHVWGVWAVAREAAAGDPLAPWVHGLGLGMPLLQYYGPLGFYLALPFSFAGLGAVASLKAAFLTFGALGSMAMHLAVGRWTGDRRAGLVAAAAYAFAPYRLLDSHYRAAFGESAALFLLPLVFLAGDAALREGGRRRLAGAAVVAGLMIVAHPISALMSAIGLLIWMLAETATDWRIVRLAGLWLLGAALAGFFVVPFFAGVKHLDVGRLAQGQERSIFSSYGLVPGDILERRLWTGLQPTAPTADPKNATDQEMPYYFGLVLLALLPLGAGWGRLPGEENSPPTPRGVPWLALAALALSLYPVGSWVSAAFPPLASIQFPWRFLGLATFATAAAAGFAAARLLRTWNGRRAAVLIPGLLAAVLILDAFPYTGAPEWLPGYRGLGYVREPEPDCGRRWGCWEHVPVVPPYPLRVSGLFLPPAEPPGRDAQLSLFCCAYPEFETPAVRLAFARTRTREILEQAGVGLFVGPGAQRLIPLEPEPYASWRNAGGRSHPRRFTRNGGEITVELDGRPGIVVVIEQYVPGWQVLTENGWKDVKPTRAGLLRARVHPGQKEVRFRYRRWDRAHTAGWLLTALSALLILALLAPLAPMAPAAPWARRTADPPPGRG